MSWASDFKRRERFKSSMYVLPIAFAIGAIVLALFITEIDQEVTLPTGLQFTTGAATGVLAAIAGAMISITGIVFSVMTLTVQYAGGAVSPRVVRTFYRDPVVKVALAMFVGTFTYSLVLIADVDNDAPDLSVMLAILFVVISVGYFLFMVNHVGQGLRAASMVRRVGDEGRKVIDEIYSEAAPAEAPEASEEHLGEPSRVVYHAGEPGVVMGVDLDGLVAAATQGNGVVVMAPSVGDFVPTGGELFYVYDDDGRVNDRRLLDSIAVGEERTLDQDPAFALRILADTANKALSPGINDPTSAVVALDQIHDLLRRLGTRRLYRGEVRDDNGILRFEGQVPSWSEYLDLGLSEIRQFGEGSAQVARRMRALLVDLDGVVPDYRRPPIAEHLERLDEMIERSFTDPEDRSAAAVPDFQGIGSFAHYGPRRAAASRD